MALTLATYSMIDGAPVNPLDFGAVGDGVADDTAAVQAAIDYALANGRGVELTAKFKLTASLIIDRLVDTTTDIFWFKGNGNGCGFYASTAITMFDTNLPFTTVPVSEFVQFDRVHFEGGVNTFVISEKFLRISFISCHFQGIKCLESPNTYAQTWYFNNCTIRSWQNGVFFDAAGSWDISFLGCIVEQGDFFFRSYDPALIQATNSVRFISNIIEGLAKTAIAVGWSRGVLIEGNYFEYNGVPGTFPNINLNVSTVPHEGLTISNNKIVTDDADVTDWGIYWGPTDNAISFGNACYGRLHDNLANPLLEGVTTFNDYANFDLWRSPRGNVISSSIVQPRKSTTIGGGGAFSIEPNLYALYEFVTGTSTGNSVNFPVGGIPNQTISLMMVNSSGAPIASWTFTGTDWRVGAWTSLAVGYYRVIDFVFDGTYWRETSRSADLVY